MSEWMKKTKKKIVLWVDTIKDTLGDWIVVKADYYDYNLLLVIILLNCFGLLMLYSTSAYRAQADMESDMFYFKKQFLIFLGSLVLVAVLSVVDYHKYMKWVVPLYIASNVLLVATKLIGREVNGAKRWIYIGPISFQPAELAKLATILFLAVVIVKVGYLMDGLKAPAIVMACGAVPSLFTYVFTKNLSTALIIAGITVMMVFVAHPKTAPFVGFAAAVVALAAVLVAVIAATMDVGEGTFRITRILVWLNPENYMSGDGYQIMQALYAIGSGGFFGKGLGNSTQKLQALPESQNDMIFSIICEELGLFGALIVTILFAFLLYRLMFIAKNAPDLLGSLIAVGIFAHIALQVVLNMAVVTNAIPTTGVTLPFISYGGTSLLFLMAEMGIALGISRQIRLKN
ncbi:MAG: FtsW/RodA/SpoVE family cell cycle protein [Lachnospiraceae bacterium]|nr:FtsW/RodA/SpoVE family cell cycle protein [Robinsoniella sp.]MDY3765802.1 FtsW/RodA/SpoVE family cell cycle protein [Lachnospiraceae bacterium]